MRKIKSLVAALTIMFFLVACSTFTLNTYKVELGVKTGYQFGKTTCWNLQKTGTFTDDQWKQVLKVGDTTYYSLDLAIKQLAAYQQAPSDSLKQIVIAAIQDLGKNWAELAKLVNTIRPGTFPDTLQLKGWTKGGVPYTVEVKRLSEGTIQILIQVGATLLTYLIQELPAIIALFQKTQISLEDIQALRADITPFSVSPTPMQFKMKWR
jgi:hypothetical protein